MISTKTEFNFEDLFLCFGKNALHNIKNDIVVKGITVDSRNIVQSNAFIALKGEQTNGHNYIFDALEKGASLVICDNKFALENKEKLQNHPYINVKNGYDALLKLAHHHRSKFEIPIVAVAGSAGKTTTKELIAAVLSKKYNTLKTYKNYNNMLGVPLMLLSLEKEHTAAVIEIATNQFGEIGLLAKTVEPTHSIITNIGKEHLEFLFDLDGVELEETALFAWSRQNNAYSFINLEDERLIKYTKVLEKRITYGSYDEANIRGTVEYDQNYYPTINISFQDDKIIISPKTPGKSSYINSLAAASIGFLLDIDKDDIKNAIEEYQPTDDKYGRMQIEKINDFTIINDTYNSNPESLNNALDVLANMKAENKIAILADMLELGETAQNEHTELLKKALEAANQIYTFGYCFNNSANELNNPKIISNLTKEEITNELKKSTKNSILLFKGSRGMRLEEIVENLKSN